MISAIIIDDEYDARQSLIDLIQLTSPMVEIIGEAEGVRSGVELIHKSQPNLVFLDIQMKDGTGFDLLDSLHQVNFHLVFTTSYDEFALKAFHYSAADYLVKPITSKALIRAIQKAMAQKETNDYQEQVELLMENLAHNQIKKIALATQEGLIFLGLEEIIRLESFNSYTTFHTINREQITVAKNLRSFEAILPSHNFGRPHHSHIVNINHVSKFIREEGGFLIMVDESKIPISRRKKDTFFELLDQQNFL